MTREENMKSAYDNYNKQREANPGMFVSDPSYGGFYTLDLSHDEGMITIILMNEGPVEERCINVIHFDKNNEENQDFDQYMVEDMDFLAIDLVLMEHQVNMQKMSLEAWRQLNQIMLAI